MTIPNTLSGKADFYQETTSVFYVTIAPANTLDHGSHGHGEQESSLSKTLATYVTPTLAVLSVIGNLLIFAVFSMKYYKKNLTAMLYQILAATDGISVVIRVGYFELPATSNDASCKVVMFSLFWSRVVSIWLLDVITVARLIVVWYPHKAKQVNSMQRYAYIIGALSLVSCIYCTPLIATAGYDGITDMEGQPRVCMFFRGDHAGTMEWYRLAFNITNVFLVLVTLLFVIIANTLIVYGINRSQRLVNASTASVSGVDKRKNTNTTIILLISSTSVLFNLPDVIFVASSSYKDFSNLDAASNHLIFLNLLPIFDCINRSMNILFFCVFGAEFRQHLKELLHHPCKTKEIPNLSSSSLRGEVFVLKISR